MHSHQYLFKTISVSILVLKGGDPRKDMKDEKVVMVTCDCCGAEIECPQEMMKTSKKHLCSSCFKDPRNLEKFTEEERRYVHVDIPMEDLADTVADSLAETITKEAFPTIWSEEKGALKTFSKKELAEEMFAIGVYMGVQSVMESLEEINEEEKMAKHAVKPSYEQHHKRK